MKPVIRYQSQLLYRKSYKPNRIIRIRPGMKTVAYRPEVLWRNDSYAVDVRQAQATPNDATKAA